jgi:hypothetical protein
LSSNEHISDRSAVRKINNRKSKDRMSKKPVHCGPGKVDLRKKIRKVNLDSYCTILEK